MRIGILTHNYPANSKERKNSGAFIFNFAQELSKKERVFVFCYDYGGRKEKYKKVPVTWFDLGGPKKKFGNWSFANPLSIYYFLVLLLKGIKESQEFVEKNKIDYCLAAWGIPSGIYAYFINRKLGIPYGVWNLGTDVSIYMNVPILKQLMILSEKNADNVFSNSPNLAKDVYKISGIKSEVLYPVTKIPEGKIFKEKLDKKSFNFLFIGRLEKVKGVDVLIEACKILKKRNINFKVYILGNGSLMQNIKAQVRKNRLTRIINLVGWADEKKVFSFMKSADSLVVSSRKESGPMVVVEAAKVGLPFVSVPVGWCPALAKKFKIGLVASKNNVDSLANVMEKMIKSKNSFKGKGKNFVKVKKMFSQEEVVTKFLSLITQ